MIVTAFRTRVFKENEYIVSFIFEHIPALEENSILAVTSKIVALGEGRTRVINSPEEREAVIKEESTFMMRTEYTWLTIKDGTVMASAGVDESNADGKLILLPKNSFDAAANIRDALQKKFNLTNFGIVITDSRILPLRAGVVGVALGYAGFKGVRNYVGEKDIFGRVMQFSRTDVADSIATAAVLEMGEGSEQQPLAIIENPTVEWSEQIDRDELKINPKDDLYRPLFEHLPKP